MSNKKSKHIGKIGWCDSDVLGLSRGHYVYIRKVRNGKCEVNTFTSIEDDDEFLDFRKVKKIKTGEIYPIPKSDLTLRKFSGIDHRVIKNISIHDIKNKGRFRIKNRHKHYIYKYMKKKN